jgi:hypothetical protein
MSESAKEPGRYPPRITAAITMRAAATPSGPNPVSASATPRNEPPQISPSRTPELLHAHASPCDGQLRLRVPGSGIRVRTADAAEQETLR